MAELTLTPYTAVQHWHLPTADGHWAAIVGDYLLTIARQCALTQPTVIGHIKALAVFSDRRYLRVSVVAPHIPASVAGEVPPGCTDLDLTLNVLVYGLEQAALEQITHTAAHALAAEWKGVINHIRLNQTGQPIPHSHPQEQKERNDE